MKIKNLLLTTLLATAGAAFVSSASAIIPVVYISGATTYRAPVTASILDQGTNGILVSGSTTCAYVGSSVYGANEAIFHGYLKGTGEGQQEVYIVTYWTGSAAGVYDIASGNPIAGYITPPSGAYSSSAVIPGSAVTWGTVAEVSNVAVVTGGVLTTYTSQSHAPDAILSDSLASTAGNELNTVPGGGLGTTVTSAGLLACGNSTRNTNSQSAADGTVGVAPMLWVVGNSTIAPTFSNISQQAAKSLVGGPTSAELFSGLHSDKSNWAVLIGRNEDSGTRIGAFAESQYGVTNVALKQYLPTFTGSPVNQSASPAYPASGNPAIPEGGTAATVATLGLWPTDWTLNTDNNIDWTHSGHSGFTGGGDVAKCLSAVNPVTNLTFAASAVEGDYLDGEADTDANASGKPGGFLSSQSVWLVGYLGVADALGSGSLGGTNGQTLSSNAGVSNGTVLSYNGVKYTGISSVQTGAYTYWVLEHMYYNPNATDTNSSTNPQKECVDDIADALFVTYASTNSNGVTDPSGATVNVAGILYNSMDFTRSGEGVVPTTYTAP